MFMTSEGETLELAPWRMRRFVRLLTDARHYPAGTPPHVLIQDLRQLIARARRVSTEPRIGTTRLRSVGACCNACMLARQRAGDGVLTLLGLTIVPPAAAARLEFESASRPATVDLRWQHWSSLAAATANARGPGVYILVRRGRPVYVGKSASLQHQLGQHLWCAQRHRDNGLAAWVAGVPAKDIAAVEYALIRALHERVTNTPLPHKVMIGDTGLAITARRQDVTTSRYANVPIRQAGSNFEWPQ